MSGGVPRESAGIRRTTMAALTSGAGGLPFNLAGWRGAGFVLTAGLTLIGVAGAQPERAGTSS